MRVEYGQIVSDVSLKPVNEQTNTAREQRESETSQEKAKKAAEEKQAELKEAVLGKVVSTSEDGDELRVRQTTDKQEAEKVTDLTGVSKSQLESLYLQGKVENIDYRQKLDSINQRQEELGIGADAMKEKLKKASEEKEKKKAEEKAKEQREQAQGKALNTEADQKSADTVKGAKTDANAAKRVIREEGQTSNTQTNTEDKKDNRVRENIELDKKNVEEMSAVSEKKMENQLRSEAMENALENDRVELMNSILGVENK